MHANFRYDDTVDVAAILVKDKSHYERVLQHCVQFCCIDQTDDADAAASMPGRATAHAKDYGEGGSVGAEADLALYKRTALNRSLSELEIWVYNNNL